eukprot:11137956-Prorocentrum_lima.AAC.1
MEKQMSMRRGKPLKIGPMLPHQGESILAGHSAIAIKPNEKVGGTVFQGKEVPKKNQIVRISGLLGGGMRRDESDDPHR